MSSRPRRGSGTLGAAARTRPAAVVRRVLSPLAAALVTGRADPVPPRPSWLRPRVPRVLGVLPFRTIDLVRIADLLLALALFWNHTGGSPYGEDLPADLVTLIMLAHAAPLALRQRLPLGAWRLAALGVLLAAPVVADARDLPYTEVTMIAYPLCVYTVAARCERDAAIGVWVVSVLGAALLHPETVVQVIVMTTVAVLFGHNVRVRRRATTRLVEEEERADRERAGRAVLAERARIARELHDVVAHHMSVIAIQAEAVPLRAGGDPGQLEAGLAEIRELSLRTLAEMRRVLGVLRDDSGVRDTAPQPGLHALEELLETSRAAGLTVSVYVTGRVDDLPEGVSLSAYRIVQESLSNAMRHAPGASVSVQIVREPSALRLRVTNGPARQLPPGDGGPPGDGERPGGAPPAGPSGELARARSGGQGLIGMRERAGMLGGRLEAGPTGDGGFAVTATLPIAEGR